MLIKKQKRCSEIVLLAIGSFPVLMLYFANMYFLFYFHSCYNKRTYLCLECMRTVFFFQLQITVHAKATAVSHGARPSKDGHNLL